MSFDLGQNLSTTITAAQNAVGAISTSVNTAQNLKAAISSAADSKGVMGAIRSINIPAAGEAVADIMSAVSVFGEASNSSDWRVRLSLSPWVSFKSSPVLAPLNDAGGLIFPYTPTVTMSSSAKYSPVSTTHSNFSFQAYHNSDPGTIQIEAPMNVEDSTQGLYWIAAVHYLRSLTKMFTGSDMKAGNPPPIIHLNGYGNYVLKNVPVVVTNFQLTLGNDCDYIGVNVVGSLASGISNIADNLGGLSDTIGGAVSGLSGITNQVTNLVGGVGQVSGILGAFGVGGTTGATSYVPTKSSFTITLQPVYSRDNIKKFSLDKFVSGGYLNNWVGFI
jgi:hypothetical protein